MPPKKSRKKSQPRPSQPRNPYPVDIRTASMRRRTMPAAVALIATVFFVFVVVYVGRSVHAALSPNISIAMVQMGGGGTQRSVSGIIIRCETVFYADRAGSVTPAVGETERVRPGTRVVSISDSGAERINENLRAAMNEVARLAEFRHSTRTDADVQRIDNNMRNAMFGNMRHFTELNLAEINRLQNSISELTDLRFQVVVRGNHDAVGEAGRLYVQSRAQQQLNTSYIYATRSGIMFNILDGQETELTPGNMRTLTRDQILTPVDHTALVPIREVEKGDPVFKLVGNTWYIAALMPNDMTQGFEEGAEVTIFVHNDEIGDYVPLTVRIEYLEHRALQNFVIFRSTRNVLGFLNQRNISIRTTDYVTRGLLVNNTAIATRRLFRIPLTHVHGFGVYAVYRRTSDGLERVEINIVEKSDTHVYVPEETFALNIGDMLSPIGLITDNNFLITESAVISEHGVFCATLGYASFTVIHLTDNRLDPGEFTLLDPARNPNIGQFDFIVIDASTVTHGRILR